jgi:hypothetical protein
MSGDHTTAGPHPVLASVIEIIELAALHVEGVSSPPRASRASTWPAPSSAAVILATLCIFSTLCPWERSVLAGGQGWPRPCSGRLLDAPGVDLEQPARLVANHRRELAASGIGKRPRKRARAGKTMPGQLGHSNGQHRVQIRGHVLG